MGRLIWKLIGVGVVVAFVGLKTCTPRERNAEPDSADFRQQIEQLQQEVERLDVPEGMTVGD